MILEILIPILVALSGIAVFVIRKLLDKSISHRYDVALEKIRLEHEKEIENLHQKSQREVEDIRQNHNIALEAVKSELSLDLFRKNTTDRIKAKQMANILTSRTNVCAILTAYCRRIMVRFADIKVHFDEKPMNLTDKEKKKEKNIVKSLLDSIDKLVLGFDDTISKQRLFVTESDIPMIEATKTMLEKLRKVGKNEDFSITTREWLSLREAYASSVGIFTEQCYFPKTIKAPFVNLMNFDIKRHIADKRARGEILPEDNQKK